MKVQLTTFCPVCKTKSNPNRLNRELGEDGVFCVNPATQKPLHTFASLEIAEAYDPSLAAPEAQGETEEETPAPTPKPKAAPAVEAPKAKAAGLDPVPVAFPDVEGLMLEEFKRMDAEAEKATANIQTHVVPDLFNTEPAKVVKFVPPPARKAPGGVLILTVRVPDQHVSFLLAEAEAQKEPIETYLQRIFEHGLDSRWFY